MHECHLRIKSKLKCTLQQFNSITYHFIRTPLHLYIFIVKYQVCDVVITFCKSSRNPKTCWVNKNTFVEHQKHVIVGNLSSQHLVKFVCPISCMAADVLFKKSFTCAAFCLNGRHRSKTWNLRIPRTCTTIAKTLTDRQQQDDFAPVTNH